MSVDTARAPAIRWMRDNDLRRVVEIEEDSFSHPWSKREFIVTLRNQNTTGLAAEMDEQLVGYLIYSNHPHSPDEWNMSLEVYNLAVAPEYRRQRIGSALVRKLLAYADAEQTFVEALVHERNMAVLYFFRSLGFWASSLVKQPYVDGQSLFGADADDDAILMTYASKQRAAQ